MCLVIDTDCLSRVFEGNNKEHPKFAAVSNWLMGKGRMVYGGTKYATELHKVSKVFDILVNLEKQRRTIKLPDDTVDPIATALKVKYPDPKFNDAHIVALVIVARCCVVCTKDTTAMRYLRRVDVFADYAGAVRPHIYSGHKTNSKLCCNEHIVGVCAEQR
jgi:predicted nucleic acid-binding protein